MEFMLKELRTRAGITQEQAAKMIGITQQGVSDFENRQNIGIDTLKKIADAYGYSCEIRFERKSKTKSMDKTKLVLEIIETIEKELAQSFSSYYECIEGNGICTDVGYIGEWFNEYKEMLKKRYCE